MTIWWCNVDNPGLDTLVSLRELDPQLGPLVEEIVNVGFVVRAKVQHDHDGKAEPGRHLPENLAHGSDSAGRCRQSYDIEPVGLIRGPWSHSRHMNPLRPSVLRSSADSHGVFIQGRPQQTA